MALSIHEASSIDGDSAVELFICRQDETRCIPLPATGDVSIGRAADCVVCIDDRSVSRRHAILRILPRLTIEDLGSSNRTLIAEERSSSAQVTLGLRPLSHERAEIAIGQTMMVGAVTLVVRRKRLSLTQSSAASVLRDARMKEVYEQAKLAARGAIGVLVLGETGVGKELLAHAVHDMSARAAGPFLSINCATLSGSLLEGELFGHEKGAFTGATQARAGLFEAASGGSVFLDEVGELQLDVQAKLLRVIEQRAVMRLGARDLRQVDVRFIAATNRDLELEVQERRFRADLFYRLNGISLTIPPLRERAADIEPLAQTFLASACAQLDRAAALTLSTAATRLLAAYHWPGNVRELRNVMERAAVLCIERTILPNHLPSNLLRHNESPEIFPVEEAKSGSQKSIHEQLRQLERAKIVEALVNSRGNQTEAAKALGMSRRTLVARLAEFELPRPRKNRRATP